jgi:hypothetical protein
MNVDVDDDNDVDLYVMGEEVDERTRVNEDGVKSKKTV